MFYRWGLAVLVSSTDVVNNVHAFCRCLPYANGVMDESNGMDSMPYHFAAVLHIFGLSTPNYSLQQSVTFTGYGLNQLSPGLVLKK